MTTKTKLPIFRKGTVRRTRVLRWIALLHVCHYATHNNRMCRGADLATWIKRRLIHEYDFDHNHFAAQMESPKFSTAYNSEVRDLVRKWNKYLERLEDEN